MLITGHPVQTNALVPISNSTQTAWNRKQDSVVGKQTCLISTICVQVHYDTDCYDVKTKNRYMFTAWTLRTTLLLLRYSNWVHVGMLPNHRWWMVDSWLDRATCSQLKQMMLHGNQNRNTNSCSKPCQSVSTYRQQQHETSHRAKYAHDWWSWNMTYNGAGDAQNNFQFVVLGS